MNGNALGYFHMVAPVWFLLCCLAGVYFARSMARAPRVNEPDDPEAEQAIFDEVESEANCDEG